VADSASPAGSSNHTPITQDKILSLTQQVSDTVSRLQPSDVPIAPTISGTLGQIAGGLQFIGGASTVAPGGTSTLLGSGGQLGMAAGKADGILGDGSLISNAGNYMQLGTDGTVSVSGSSDPATLGPGSTLVMSDNTQFTYLDLKQLHGMWQDHLP